jgi:YVTN family beta-propeller protein
MDITGASRRSLWLLAVLGSAPSALLAQNICNAPVAPDTIYVGRVGSNPGISVVDLNGFGQSTGDPAFDPTHSSFAFGNSNFPNNPNVQLQGSLLRPPLAPGLTTRTGGSSGVFTLTKNEALDTLLVSSPTIAAVGDMMLGWPLDVVANNGPAPFGCQAGGGNMCVIDSLQQLDVILGGPNTLAIAPPGTVPWHHVVGGGNPISFAPHPNPPPLLDFPTCASPLIFGQEPTSILTPLSNLLAPGDSQGDPAHGLPPTGLLSLEQNSGFFGPGPASPVIATCTPYVMRQQLGHFLYSIDSVAHQIVVLNSNTFDVITRIAVPDPTELAMGPNLDLLAVTNRATGTVSFIDIDPRSPNFHTVIQSTTVESQPAGIAWDPGNEDILVCNEGSNSVSIISTSTLTVRKRVTNGLDRPFGVAVTQRQVGFGLERAVYFAYVLDRSGHVSLFESGPNTVNGWGYDDIIGQTPFVFRDAKAIQPDPLHLNSGVWIAHTGQLAADGSPTALTGGAVTNLQLRGTHGAQPLSVLGPHMRQLVFKIVASIGSDQLTGDPLDIAFDDQRNLGALANITPYGPGFPAEINGKSQVRATPSGIANVNEATYMFLSVRDPATGVRRGIDVIRLSNGTRVDTNAFRPGVQSIPARGAAIVMDYFRQ